MIRLRISVLTILLLHSPLAALQAQEERGAAADLPRVHVLATGGTISNTDGDRLTGEELVRGLPGLEEVARVTVEQFANVASGAIALEQWLEMAGRIDTLLQNDPGIAGVVIPHGTDTMEETAYFLDLTLAHCRPVVVTGAMRRASDPGRGRAGEPLQLHPPRGLVRGPRAWKRGPHERRDLPGP